MTTVDLLGTQQLLDRLPTQWLNEINRLRHVTGESIQETVVNFCRDGTIKSCGGHASYCSSKNIQCSQDPEVYNTSFMQLHTHPGSGGIRPSAGDVESFIVNSIYEMGSQSCITNASTSEAICYKFRRDPYLLRKLVPLLKRRFTKAELKDLDGRRRWAYNVLDRYFAAAMYNLETGERVDAVPDDFFESRLLMDELGVPARVTVEARKMGRGDMWEYMEDKCKAIDSGRKSAEYDCKTFSKMLPNVSSTDRRKLVHGCVRGYKKLCKKYT